MTVYAGDMVVNHAASDIMVEVEAIRKHLEKLKAYKVNVTPDLIAKAIDGSISSAGELVEAAKAG